ncbi:MAG: molybdenum cofactor guanylyltransferase MobA [Aquificaceae bacterium]|nr:molybdenum cofactor guanylyltransferase MobA [Aquificaceae bacterium]MDW8066350.1 molybdenum cofactor guanylyltransferase MobA [Aquificaceae bacterium]MDW8423241.1 molybdenum cofactor guanylyltransferase MobA [Aquificaceae bacterium]
MIDCFVLAGGQSRRFGEDKLLYSLGGKKLIEHTMDALKGHCKRVYLLTKDRRKFHFLKGVEILEDLLEEQLALSGIYTAVKSLGEDRCLIVAGDMPALKDGVIKKLVHKSEPPLTVFRIKGRLYPLPGVYYKSLLPMVEAYISSGGKKVVDFVESVPHKELDEGEILEEDPELVSFININTKQDLEHILKSYGGKGF